MQEPLDILQKVERVTTPPFLFTRIEAKLQEANEIKLTPKFTLAICSIFLLVLTINFIAMNASDTEQNKLDSNYSETSLSPEYNAYY